MMLNCFEASRLLSEAQERPLILRERVTLGIHLSWCSGCRNFRRHMHALRTISRGYGQRRDTDDERVGKR
ncbi:zf-HC2 domain-containing protein [Paludibacterium purpuratum]|uniref:Uncharacterized protein n=1 Tax=Paludibacterium purpuratum TaxID=1144873 RepID=A0A4R7B190_9NEIS|nr:zf-HC2 domain-containing protein [Paludibacterium purpuratum]TDR76451.1 hypothetical protein DFP86_11134 [Paludibacterium purpuratum]